jgi:hypothetical protein
MTTHIAAAVVAHNMSGKVKNTADALTLKKALRGSWGETAPTKSQWGIADEEEFLEVFVEVFLDVLHATPRPTAKTMQAAATLAWQNFEGAKIFGQRFADVVSYCRDKCKSCRSGAKLSAACLRVVRTLKTLKPVDLQPEASTSRPSSSTALSSDGSQPKAMPADSPPSRRDARRRLKSEEPQVAKPEVAAAGTDMPLRKRKVPDINDVRASYGLSPVRKKSITVTVADSPTAVGSRTPDPLDNKPATSGSKPSPAVSAMSNMVLGQPVYWDPIGKAVVVLSKKGETLQADSVAAGDNGFLIATFGEEQFQTIAPNLMVAAIRDAPVMKKPSGKQVLKRPASKKKKQKKPVPTEPEQNTFMEEGEEEEEQDDMEEPHVECCPEEVIPARVAMVAAAGSARQTYHIVNYKSTGAVAMRQSAGNKSQVFQLTSKVISKADLIDIAERALERLNAGDNELVVKSWAKETLANKINSLA